MATFGKSSIAAPSWKARIDLERQTSECSTASGPIGRPADVDHDLPLGRQSGGDEIQPLRVPSDRDRRIAIRHCGPVHDRLVRREQRIPALITGFLLFAQISLFNLGVSRTSTSHTTVLINTFIFWVVIIEHFVTRNHRLSWRSVAGLLLAASGVLMLIGTSESAASAEQRDSTSIVGDIILFASAFLLGLKIVYTKRAVRVVPPGTLILWHDVIGVAMFVCLSGLTEYDRAWTPDWPSCLGLVYQGLFVAGVCFALQAVLLRKYSASQISVFSFATPLVGVALSVLLRGDQLSPWLLTSGTVVACGILLVNLPNRKQKKLE